MTIDPIDLTPLLDAAGPGVHWTLDGSADLNANLVRLEPGGAIGEHTNDAVEVLLVALSGRGTIQIDGVEHPVGPLTAIAVPKGSRRRIQAGDRAPGLTYLTVHRRRGPLSIATPKDQCEEGGEDPCLAHLLDDDGRL
jgi:quercetin dioxygenase-like cupin family protein